VTRAFERDYYQDTLAESKYTFIPLSNPFCNLDCERYNYQYSNDMETVSSLDLESEQGDYASETEFSEMNEDLLYVLDKNYFQV
jgi:hypothetical protein